MTYAVVVQQTAVTSLARIRSDDEEAFAEVKRAMSGLGEEPRPDTAVAWGATGVFRLHLGSVRILYEVDDATSTVYVINVAMRT